MDLNTVLLADCDINVASDSEAPRPNSSTGRRKPLGLRLRKGVWHIDKVLFGKRICESTYTGDLVEAEALLAHRSCDVRRLHQYGRTFREAGVRFVAESGHLRGLDREVEYGALEEAGERATGLKLRSAARRSSTRVPAPRSLVF